MDKPSALSANFQPHRPAGSGWVEYHDLGETVGSAGLAMTWRDPAGPVRFAAVVDRQRDGRVTVAGTVGDLQDVAGCVGDAWRSKNVGPPEETTLRMMFPFVSPASPAHAKPGLPPLGEHAVLARRAVAEARLPNPMRGALQACLDKGTPRSVTLSSLRERRHSPLWPALTLSMTDPWLFGIVGAADKTLLTADDPLAAIRGRWPGLTTGHLGRMRQACAPASDMWAKTGRSTPTLCLDLLAACPVDWWPEVDEWSHFAACSQVLNAIRGACPDAGTLRDLAAPSKGDWTAFAERLRRAAGIGQGARAWTSLTYAAIGCGDPIRSLASAATLPLLAPGLDEEGMTLLEESLGRQAGGGGPMSTVPQAAYDLAGRLLYGDKSAAAILEASKDWHAHRQAIDSGTRAATAALAWPPLFEGTFEHGKVAVVAVASHAALRAEGWKGDDGEGVQGLDHCVATRLADCVAGRAHILSVRSIGADGRWERLSTCEVSLREGAGGEPRIEVREHKGLENADPCPEAEEAVTHLSEALAAGRVAVPAEASAPRRATRSLEDLCGYDWREPTAVATAFDAWRAFLPRWARGLGPDELRDSLAERGMLPAPEGMASHGPGTP